MVKKEAKCQWCESTKECRCTEWAGFPERHICHECGKDGPEFGVVAEGGSLHKSGTPVGTPIVASLYTCQNCNPNTKIL